MRFLIFVNILFLAGCQTLPQLYQAAEDIATDTALSVRVSKEAIQKQGDLSISVDIRNNPNSQ